MTLLPTVCESILSAQSKALATSGPAGLNVVPVSTVFIRDNAIWLINYYFRKTAENLESESPVSLVCWSGFDGYQIKGNAIMHTNGDTFDQAKMLVSEILPNRTVLGVVVIIPTEVHDISLTPEQQK